MFSIISRAQALQPLKAWERAFVKLVGSIKPAVLSALATALSSAVLVQHTYNPYVLLCIGGSAAFAAAYMSLEKLYNASTEPAAQKLGQAMQADQSAVLGAVNAALGVPNDVKKPVQPVIPTLTVYTPPTVNGNIPNMTVVS